VLDSCGKLGFSARLLRIRLREFDRNWLSGRTMNGCPDLISDLGAEFILVERISVSHSECRMKEKFDTLQKVENFCHGALGKSSTRIQKAEKSRHGMVGSVPLSLKKLKNLSNNNLELWHFYEDRYRDFGFCDHCRARRIGGHLHFVMGRAKDPAP
jgi:hypothetical protein